MFFKKKKTQMEDKLLVLINANFGVSKTNSNRDTRSNLPSLVLPPELQQQDSDILIKGSGLPTIDWDQKVFGENTNRIQNFFITFYRQIWNPQHDYTIIRWGNEEDYNAFLKVPLEAIRTKYITLQYYSTQEEIQWAIRQWWELVALLYFLYYYWLLGTDPEKWKEIDPGVENVSVLVKHPKRFFDEYILPLINDGDLFQSVLLSTIKRANASMKIRHIQSSVEQGQGEGEEGVEIHSLIASGGDDISPVFDPDPEEFAKGVTQSITYTEVPIPSIENVDRNLKRHLGEETSSQKKQKMEETVEEILRERKKSSITHIEQLKKDLDDATVKHNRQAIDDPGNANETVKKLTQELYTEKLELLDIEYNIEKAKKDYGSKFEVLVDIFVKTESELKLLQTEKAKFEEEKTKLKGEIQRGVDDLEKLESRMTDQKTKDDTDISELKLSESNLLKDLETKGDQIRSLTTKLALGDIGEQVIQEKLGVISADRKILLDKIKDLEQLSEKNLQRVQQEKKDEIEKMRKEVREEVIKETNEMQILQSKKMDDELKEVLMLQSQDIAGLAELFKTHMSFFYDVVQKTVPAIGKTDNFEQKYKDLNTKYNSQSSALRTLQKLTNPRKQVPKGKGQGEKDPDESSGNDTGKKPNVVDKMDE